MALPGTARLVRVAVAIVALIGATMATGSITDAQAQSFPQIGKFCLPGQGGGECANPRSVDVDPETGHTFVADASNNRIQEFTAWGEFVKAWGWGVVASGPGNDPQNEVQQVSVDATGGTFVLRYGEPGMFTATQTAAIPLDATATALQEALEAAPAFGEVDRFAPGDLSVTGPAGGPWEIEFLGKWEDSDFGSNWRLYVDSAGLTGGAATASVTTLQDGGSFEVCVPANGDVCRQGSSGSAPGQLGAEADRFVTGLGIQGIAVDSAGDIYVVDMTNHRVQKYSPSGEFLLMFGGEVNKTTGADVCTKADIEADDECGAAAFGDPGPGEGEFGPWTNENGTGYWGDYIDAGSDDTVYVGDNGRIQKFAPNGTFAGQIAGSALAGESVQSLVVDGVGDLYVSFAGGSFVETKENVLKLDPSGNEIHLIEIGIPKGLATDAAGNVYVIDRVAFESSEVLGFDPSGQPLDLESDGPGLGFGADELNRPTGIVAASPPTCGLTAPSIMVANAGRSLLDPSASSLGFFGAAPDPDVCPPPARPPTIAAQFATSVDSGGATLKARINPHFWADTRYYVEYGTGKCSEGGCDSERPAAPGSLLTSAVTSAEITSAAVFLDDLEPGTTYHYRFVSQSGGGQATGEERTFRTPLPGAAATACLNDAFRTGPSAKLPDCRAYELVSPLDKANGDVARTGQNFAQAADSGVRMTFSSLRAFADPQAAPLSSQYLSARQSDGWLTESISPPRSVPSLHTPLDGLPSFFKAFSPDLCSGWVIGDTELTLTPDAPQGMPNLYRRDNCGENPYRLLTSSLPPGFGLLPNAVFYFPTPQGSSVDSTRSVFRANAALRVTEGGPRAPFVCSAFPAGGTGLLAASYRWLRDGTPIPGATERTYTSTPDDDGHSVQCEATESGPGGASLVTSDVWLVEPLSPVASPSPGVRRSGLAPPSGAPTISGTPKAGEALTCTPGTWTGSPTFAYQWFRNATEIAGETASTYVPIPSDRGKSIQCRAIGTNVGGSAVADSASVVIEATLPFNETDPSLSGTPSVGQTLTCDPGTWQGSPSFSYQWLRGGANIAGATASTYVLAAADEGKAVQCRVAAASPDAIVAEASSRVVVAPPPGTTPPELTAPPSVSGEAEVGEVLTCNPGTWTGSPTFAYRWQRNGVPITPAGEANKSTYTLVAADLGKAVQCQVTATNAGGAVAAIDGAAGAVAYPLSPEPPAAPKVESRGNYQVYIADEEGTLRLVSVLPDGTASSGNASAGTNWSITNSANTTEDSVLNAVSDDGSRVFWTQEQGKFAAGVSGAGPGRLYLRLNATEEQSGVSGGECTEATRACTVAVSASPQGRFVSANPQGTRVIYATGEAGAASLRLFEATIEGTGGEAIVAPELIADGVQGVMGTSEDASRVYFVSTEVLTGGEENSEGSVAQAAGQNLYLYERGEGFDFLGTLAPRDTLASTSGSGANSPPTPVSSAPNRRTARVSPDGLHAAFTSTMPLTGYDNADAVSGQPDSEVFVYDAAASGGEGELACASCNPSGARPVGREIWVSGDGGKSRLWAAAMLPGWNSQSLPSRALSDDGNRVFFDSFDSLVPGDSNGKADVYQWEAPGSGSCTEADPSFSADNGGCIALISSGEGAEDSQFLDASSNGADVFFLTQSSLVPQDYGLRDVYDARVNGGFPAPASPPPGCEGEACQGVTEAPNDPTPASQSFQGAGNVRSEETRPRRCPKGKQRVKRRGQTRCVKKRGGKAKRQASKSGRAGR